MLDIRKIGTMRNDAEWCDAVCRAHGNPGEFNTDMWLNRHPVPRFYPNVVTLVEPCQRQRDLIDDLVAARLPHGWAIKDSCCTLDFASRGFQVLFIAQWIYLPVSRIRSIPTSGKGTRWEVVRSLQGGAITPAAVRRKEMGGINAAVDVGKHKLDIALGSNGELFRTQPGTRNCAASLTALEAGLRAGADRRRLISERVSRSAARGGIAGGGYQ
jgi:hypothetical protein